ncbi:hypothetical protein CspHIS471_0408650 [Cutaneotrichosporon sp. HIS471]|nr:hypothetical protein CspHIS471_0408650 [Cutaneotrichosporon sp. HIS471]
MLLRWHILFTMAAVALAAPVERQGRMDLLGLLALVLNPIMAIVNGGFATVSTLLPAEAVIRPATAGGKAIKITGGRSFGYDAFLGIPFAEPPTGAKRWDRPTPKVFTGDIQARKFAPSCMQSSSPLDGANGRSEDCLYLDVMTPNRVAGSNSKLPVMVWIYGGGFSSGSTALYTMLSPLFIKRSSATGKPVIVVNINYRMGVWGFPAGPDLAGSANNGIRDQQVALKWVRENIASFGGDPDKVTIFGESAGAISAAIHMLQENDNTFRGAIMQSGAANVLPMIPAAEWTAPYNDFVGAAGCAGAANKVDCLKGLIGEKVLEASIHVLNMPKYKGGQIPFVWRPLIDGDIIKESPSKLLGEGRFARKPFINGQCKDEATLFANWGINDKAGLNNMLQTIYPRPIDNVTFNAILEKYPNKPELGAPFGTGSNTFLLSPLFKQAAAIGTDLMFAARRRDMLRKANQAGWTKTWTYHFEGVIPVAPGFLGSGHAYDIAFMWGVVKPFLLFWSFADTRLSENMMDYWTTFAHNLDPNRPGLPAWSAHSFPANKNMLRLKAGAVGMMQDNFREDGMAMFNDPARRAVDKLTMLDHAYFPHIVENALRRLDHSTLLSLRLHVVLARSPDGRGYSIRSVEGALPVGPWASASSSSEAEARIVTLLAHAKVLDVHTSLPYNTATAPLLDVLGTIPTLRAEYHSLVGPSPQTYVQEYAVYMGSHWRGRTFYFEPPPDVERYVVHLRYHVDRRLCELYGPAPSCERILAPASLASVTIPVIQSAGQNVQPALATSPSYILIFTGRHEPAIPSVPTQGLAASQRRTVHTLLYELAAEFEGVRRLQGARLTLVGAEEFITSLCGPTSTAEAAQMFERKLVLARRDMEGPREDTAPPVQYLSHAEYEALVGARAYEAETRPLQLY